MLYDLALDDGLRSLRDEALTAYKEAALVRQPQSHVAPALTPRLSSASAGESVELPPEDGAGADEAKDLRTRARILSSDGETLHAPRLVLLQSYTSLIPNDTAPDSELPLTSPSTSPVALNLVTTRLLLGSKRVYVYSATGFPGHDELAVKVMEDELDYVVEVFEYGGASPLRWADIPEEKRWYLYISLALLHRDYGIWHGDVAPRNVVGPSDDGNPPRWIDWGLSSTEHHCPRVKKCRELAQLAEAMGLAADPAVLRATVKHEGLRY